MSRIFGMCPIGGGGFSGGRNSVSLQLHPPPLDFMAKIPKTWKEKSFYMGNKNKVVLVKMFFLVCVHS